MFDHEQETVSLSRQAYERLRDEILTLKRAPGELLDEAVLMSDLQLGRTPIREALQRLSCEGLVLIRPRRGTYVASLSLTDMQQIFELRQELEGYAAALAAERANETDLAVLDSALDPLLQISDPGESLAYIQVDRAFHRAVARASHNKYLENQLGRMYNLNLRLWYFALAKLGPIRDMAEQHRAIQNAIQCRDSHIAEAAMRKHIREFQSRIKAVL